MQQLTKEQIEGMVKLGETECVEFKESFSVASKDIIRSMAGFANNKGGYIFCGVADKNIIVGLKLDKAKIFCDMQHSKFPNNILEIFSPEINWESYYVESIGVGVIYIKESSNKPIIAVKNYEDNIKASGIYYRYHNETKLIGYSELAVLMEAVKRKERDRENKRWLELLEKIKLYGIDNAGILDPGTGIIYNSERNYILDEKLFNKIKSDLLFIKEGEFNEKIGAKALKVVGNLKLGVPGSVVINDSSPTAIIGKDIYLDFLLQKDNINYLEYLRAMCDGQGYFPMYFYMFKSGRNKQEIKNIILGVQTTKKSQVKNILKAIDTKENKLYFSTESDGRLIELTTAQRKHKKEKEKLLKGDLSIYVTDEEIKEFLSAIRTLNNREIKRLQDGLLYKLYNLTNKYYASDEGTGLLDLLKKAVRYVDEVLYKELWLGL